MTEISISNCYFVATCNKYDSDVIRSYLKCRNKGLRVQKKRECESFIFPKLCIQLNKESDSNSRVDRLLYCSNCNVLLFLSNCNCNCNLFTFFRKVIVTVTNYF